MTRKPKKVSLQRAVEEATDIIEKHLSSLPEEEQEARVAAIGRRSLRASALRVPKLHEPVVLGRSGRQTHIID